MLKRETAEDAFLALVGAILNDEKPSALPDGVMADDVFAIGSRQDMAPIAFCALNSLSPKPASERWGDHQTRFLDSCMRSEIQMSEYHELVEYLCGHGVRIIPLKGCVIKDLYPAPNLRCMRDIDLLYEGVTPGELAKLMEARGYTTESLDVRHHDVFHKRPCVSVELHRLIVPDDSPYKSAFENMFERAVPNRDTPNLFDMRPEDLYVHVVAHSARHLTKSGLGVRPIADIYVLNQKYGGSWDFAYIEEQLRMVALDRFEAKLKEVAYAFFDKEGGEASEVDMEFFFRGGTFGKFDNAAWAYMGKGGKSRIGFFLGYVFPPYSNMKSIYPLLERLPIMLPLMWLHRITFGLMHRKGLVVRATKSKVNAEDERYASDMLAHFGLD